VAEMTLESRRGDGASTDVPYIPSDLPGEWRRTPPFFRPPTAPGWGYVEFFALPEDRDHVPESFPALDSPQYAAALNEVKLLGARDSSARSAYDTETARFWSDFSYTATPPGHWQEIVADIVRRQETPLSDTARLFALVSMAQADGGIVSWQAKYQYNLWRPVTAIRRASEDGNALTEEDLGWEPLLPAPPFPAYVSGHSTFSMASAQVLANFFGTDALVFSARSDSVPNVVRTYHSVRECAEEIGMSRIYGGIHYSFDNVAGKKCGLVIANHVSANYLLPNSMLPTIVIEAAESGSARVRVHAAAGTGFTLEGSDDLIAWRTVSAGTAALGGTLIGDMAGSGLRARFYRLRTP
jgi:hypothetical protein